ncbi:MAG TPA: thioredoxin-disulfide reductase [Spirochaetota bacterium]|nr:thioredoxin-disulfide reductase [Spirochaetota bacterium]
MIHDLIIIGGGPAGLSCGIYSGRAGNKTLIIEKIGTGGQMMLTDVIDNYPGFEDGITGFELQDKMVKQCKKFNVAIEFDDVKSIKLADGIFSVQCENNRYDSPAVVIASGAKHRQLGVKGEKEFSGRGVSYCGTCDGPFFRDKDVIVIGGGDSALTEALFISKFAKSIKVIHRKNRFRAVDSLVELAKKDTKISFVFDTVVEEIKGDNFVNSVIIKNLLTNEIKEVVAEGVFIFVGLDPNSEFLPDEILDDKKYIITNSKMETSIKGLYAAGDIRSGAFRQVVCATSDGATAAFYAGEFIDEIKGRTYK